VIFFLRHTSRFRGSRARLASFVSPSTGASGVPRTFRAFHASRASLSSSSDDRPSVATLEERPLRHPRSLDPAGLRPHATMRHQFYLALQHVYHGRHALQVCHGTTHSALPEVP
jgi:hypothetical protein